MNGYGAVSALDLGDLTEARDAIRATRKAFWVGNLAACTTLDFASGGGTVTRWSSVPVSVQPLRSTTAERLSLGRTVEQLDDDASHLLTFDPGDLPDGGMPAEGDQIVVTSKTGAARGTYRVTRAGLRESVLDAKIEVVAYQEEQ